MKRINKINEYLGDKNSLLDALNNISDFSNNKLQNQCHDINNETDKIRKEILVISRFLGVDKNDEYFTESLITKLKESDNFTLFGIGKKVEEILGDNYKKSSGIGNKYELIKNIKNTDGYKLLLLLKMNGFYEINDLHTVKEGDIMLEKIYEKLKSFFLPLGFQIYKTTLTTFGLFKKTDENFDIGDFISIYKEKLSEFKVQGPEELMDIKITTGMSCGEGKNLYRESVEALYESNSGGKFTKYSEAIGEKHKWEKIVNRALDEKDTKYELVPFFQGIVDFNKDTFSCESLLRIKEGNTIHSPFFLKYIERNTLIMKKITLRMIELVTKKLKNSKINFSINFTIKDLGDKNIINNLLANLKKNNIDPTRVIIEILEEKIHNKFDEKRMLDGIKLLKNAGIKIYIDDFGEGESSFIRVSNIGPDGIKIDGSLIKNIFNSNIEKSLRDINVNVLMNIINFIHGVGAKAVAEYVEDEETFEFLKRLGVDYFQGYEFYKPVAVFKKNKFKY